MENKQNGKYNAKFQNSESRQMSINPDIWRNLNKVHRLDGLQNIPETLFKYMKIDSLTKCFELKDGKPTLLFAEPCIWKDPFERLIYNAAFNGGNANVTPKTYACCMTTGVSSEAAWLVYGQNEDGDIERCAKLVIDTKKLLEELEKDAQKRGYSVYVGMVDYEPSQKLRQMSTSSSLFVRCLENNIFTRKTFLRLLCFKRRMYHYEEEIRFLLVKDDEMQTPNCETNLHDSNFPACINLYDVVKKIYVDEMCKDFEIKQLKQEINFKDIEKTRIFERRTKPLKFDITNF